MVVKRTLSSRLSPPTILFAARMAPRTPSPLLAVLLVTSSSRGVSLAFRYPRRPKVEKRYSRVRYHVEDDDDGRDGERLREHEDEMDDEYDGNVELSDDDDEVSEGSDSDTSEANDVDDERSEVGRREMDVASSTGGTGVGAQEMATAAEQRYKRLRAYQQYLGYDCDILASILAPKRELCHRKFELVIDDLAFVGHPVCVDKDGHWDAEAQQRARGRDYKKKSDLGGYVVGSPTSEAAGESSSQAPMTLFHLILVLDRPDPSPHLPLLDLTSWLQIFYDNIAFKLTAALFAEQIRCEYVTRESEKLGVLRDRCMDDAQSYASYLTHSMHHSSLARSLQQVYSSISLSSNAFVTINDTIDVHLQLPPILHDPTRMMRIADIETPIDANDAVYARGPSSGPINIEDLIFEEWTRTTGPFLLPWKTLLLLNTSGESQEGGEQDEISNLDMAGERGIDSWARKFTSLLTPTLEGIPTFADLADLLDWSLEDDVYPMVRHLIYYREARVIDVPRIQNYYAISPLFDLSDLPSLSTSWSVGLPSLPPLPAFLATLSSALKPFSMQLPKDQRRLCLEALIWLLRRQVVVQMHVRLRLVASEEAKLRAAKVRRAERARIQEQRQRRAARRASKAGKRQTLEAVLNSASQLSTLSRSAPADVIGAGDGYERGRSRDRSMSPGQADADEELPTTTSALSATRPNQSNPMQRNVTITSLALPLEIPAPVPLPDQIEELKFERRPVLRSRSPSRMLALASERGPGSLSTRGSGSRPGTPRGRGRVLTHSREPSGKLSTELSQQGLSQPSSVPASALLSSLAHPLRASAGESKRSKASRSPSRARMRVTGFGDDEEIFVESSTTAADESMANGEADDDRRLSLVGEEGEGATTAETRYDRTDVRPSDDGGGDDGDGGDSEASDSDDLEDGYLGGVEDMQVEAWEADPKASIIAEPSRAGGEENEWIAVMVEDRPAWLAQRLFKLLPFLNGKHTIDEIVYRLDWRRKDLRAVLVAFKDEILTLVHP